MPTLRFGLFGLRGAGKTIALSVGYLAENCEGLEVTVRDDDTIRYLRPIAEILQRGEVPPPTMVADPTTLKWHVRFGEVRYELETIDFAGELLDVIGQDGDPVAEQMMKQLRTQVRDWFISCDAIVLFIDSTDHGTPRYRDAFIRLLDEMSKRPTIRGTHQRAVVVVFTKGDQVARRPEQLLSPGETQRILEGHPLYQVVQRRLEQHAEQLQFGIFLTSALGWQFISTRNQSERQVKPCNLFAALRWGLEQAAQIVKSTHALVMDELHQELIERREGPHSWIWALADSRPLNTMLDATDRHYQLSKGPYAEQFASLRQVIQHARSKQLRGITVGLIGVFLAFLLGCWGYLRQDQVAVYDAYETLGKEEGEPGAKKRLSYYDANIGIRKWDWFWALQSRREKTDANAGKDAFILWVAEDKELTDLGRNPHRYLAAETYLLTRGSYTAKADAAIVQRVLKDTKAEYDDERKKWNAISDLPTRTSKQCEDKSRQLQNYLHRVDALWLEETRTLRQVTLQEWDRHEYANLTTMTNNRDVEKYFSNLEKAASNYLHEKRHTQFMKGPIDAMLRQIQAINGIKEYSVVVQRVNIPKDSDLDGDWRGNPNCSVTVTVGSESRQTKKVMAKERDPNGTFSIAFNEKLDPFRLTGGEYTTATVTVTTHRTLFPNNVATCTVTEQTLPLVKLHGPVQVPCKAKKTVTVVFKCDDACLNSLPPFKVP